MKQKLSFKKMLQATIFVMLLAFTSTFVTAQNYLANCPRFTYEKWSLSEWGLGIYDVVTTGSGTFDKEVKVIKCGTSFTAKEIAEAWANGHHFGFWMKGNPTAHYLNSNQMPLYLFGYIYTKPDDVIGKNASSRHNEYAYTSGTVAFEFDARKAGNYRFDVLIRHRDKDYWDENSWKLIGGIDFVVSE